MSGRFRVAALVALTALLLVSCGGSSKKYDQFTETSDFTLIDFQFSTDEVVETDNGDTTGLEKDSNDYVALIRKYLREGMPKKEAINKLAAKANEVQAYCDSCTAMLDRERQDLLGGAG